MIFLQYFCLRTSDSSDGMELRKEEVCLRKRAESRASRTLNLTSGKCFRFRLSKRFSHLYQQHQIFVPGRPAPTSHFYPNQHRHYNAFSSEPSKSPPGRLIRRSRDGELLCGDSAAHHLANSFFKSQKKTRMSFKLAARAVAVFSLPIRTGHSFWSLSRIQAPQRLFTGTFNYAASTEQQEALEKRRAKWREYARAWWERLKSDPEAYEKVRRKNRQYHQKLRENPRTDPTSLEKAKAKLDRHRKFNQITWATSESSRKNRKLYDWVTRVVANKTQVVWTTHKPVITTERVEHDCATCHRAYHNGVKLWYV